MLYKVVDTKTSFGCRLTSAEQNETKFNVYFEFDGTETMNLSHNTGWFIGIFAFVALFTGSSMLTSDFSNQQAMNQFADLTDSDIDVILAVKAEMQAAKIQSN